MEINIIDMKEFLREQKPNVKESSIEAYYKALSSVKSNVGGYKNFTDYDLVIDKLSVYPSTTQNNYLMALIIALEGFNQNKDYADLIYKYKQYRKTNQDKYMKESKNNVKTEFQKEHDVSFEQVNTMIDRLGGDLKKRKLNRKGITITPEDNTILNQYTIFKMLLETGDRNEVSGMILMTPTSMKNLLETEKNQNYLVKEKKGFTAHYYDHKMKGKTDKDTHTFSPELVKILRTLIRLKKIKTYDTLITNSANTAITSNQISQILAHASKKYIGKNVGSRVIRHLVITKEKEPLVEVEKVLNEKKEAMAKKHGHSVFTMDAIYDDN